MESEKQWQLKRKTMFAHLGSKGHEISFRFFAYTLFFFIPMSVFKKRNIKNPLHKRYGEQKQAK